MRRLLKSNIGGNIANKAKIKKIAQRLKNAFTISVLLGLTWVFGFLAIHRARMAFQLLFCVANSFQGVLVFVLFCLIQEDVQKVIMMTACCVSQDEQMKKMALSSGKKGKSVSSVSNASYSVGYLPSMSYSAEDNTATLKSNMYDVPDYTDNNYEAIDNQNDSNKVNLRFSDESHRHDDLYANDLHPYSNIN